MSPYRSLALLGLACCIACSESKPAADGAAAQGEKIYKNVCITCHDPDPTREGAVGPALAGSSEELLRAKVLRGEYPPGYSPRRSSKLMPPLPYLEEQIPALAAFLSAAGE